ncbi:MAG: LCP family protein [Eubacteriales bacterium]|nr:LCP family protein [Eubacteriales bacterium]
MTDNSEKKTQQGLKERLAAILKSRELGFVLAAIEMLLALVLIGMIMYLNVLPLKYFLPIVVIMLMISLYIVFSMYLKKLRTLGKVLAVILSIIWVFGIYVIGYANGTFGKVGGANTKTDIMNVYVMKDDAAESVKDAAAYTFGKLSGMDKDNTEKTIDDINKEAGASISTKDYTTMEQLAEALYLGEVQAIIMNQAYADALIDIEGYTDFAEKTKIIYGNTIKTEIKVEKNVDVTSNAFSVYISGIDTSGSVSTTSRSDVNILAIVNPDIKEILLVNTPRDYYVPLSISNGVKDKLTHAGIYGVDVSMDTLGMLYGIDVNYFFRLNFTGFTGIIDALGGVSVHSDYAFKTLHGGYNIAVGDNYLNGAQALGFVRERYSLSGGDNQRGKNQMAMISAVVKKMASPALLNNYSGLMDSISGSFETSLSSSQISDLVRLQLNEGGGWNICQYAVKGMGDMSSCYSISSGEYYVMRPDENTVVKAKELIQKVYCGETLTSADLKE